MSYWFLLSLSIGAEVLGTVLMKISGGLSKPIPTIGMGICYVGAIWLMGIVTKRQEIGMTYAIWAGIGTALTAIVGAMFFHESMSAAKIVGVSCVVVGVVFLNLGQNT